MNVYLLGYSMPRSLDPLGLESFDGPGLELPPVTEWPPPTVWDPIPLPDPIFPPPLPPIDPGEFPPLTFDPHYEPILGPGNGSSEPLDNLVDDLKGLLDDLQCPLLPNNVKIKPFTSNVEGVDVMELPIIPGLPGVPLEGEIEITY